MYAVVEINNNQAEIVKSRDEEIKRLTEDFNELKDTNKEMHLNFKAYRDEINKLQEQNKQLEKQYLNEVKLTFDLKINLQIVYKSIITKDYIAAVELLSEILEGE